MVDVAMGQQDALDPHAELRDRLQDARTSPPGSITTAALARLLPQIVQFCWNGVTGTIAALISGMVWFPRVPLRPSEPENAPRIKACSNAWASS